MCLVCNNRDELGQICQKCNSGYLIPNLECHVCTDCDIRWTIDLGVDAYRGYNYIEHSLTKEDPIPDEHKKYFEFGKQVLQYREEWNNQSLLDYQKKIFTALDPYIPKDSADSS
jgi:hypothetical protein